MYKSGSERFPRACREPGWSLTEKISGSAGELGSVPAHQDGLHLIFRCRDRHGDGRRRADHGDRNSRRTAGLYAVAIRELEAVRTKVAGRWCVCQVQAQCPRACRGWG